MADPASLPADPTTAALVAALRRDGVEGPVLVVTTDDTAGGLAPVWAEAFARVGWHHRVRVLACPVDPAEIADVAADMITFAPGVIVVAAPPDVTAAVLGMAGADARPVVIWPSAQRTGAGSATPTD
ncbi:MAG: hypothetical protein DWI05_03890 [Planctomycetota bacterium]|nr:MAG: hypothetical protein DWI05_03890 [Planctomycetota bacterium]